MAEEEQAPAEAAPAGEAAAAEAPKKGLSVVNIALGLQVVILLAAAGVMAKFAFFNHRPHITKEVMVERAITSLRDDVANIRVVNLPEVTVNLPQKRTLMAQIQLEVSNAEVESALKKRMPALQSKLLDILGMQDTQMTDNLPGKLLLKEKIRSTMNSELEKVHWDTSKGIVREVYFVNLILQ